MENRGVFFVCQSPFTSFGIFDGQSKFEIIDIGDEIYYNKKTNTRSLLRVATAILLNFTKDDNT